MGLIPNLLGVEAQPHLCFGHRISNVNHFHLFTSYTSQKSRSRTIGLTSFEEQGSGNGENEDSDENGDDGGDDTNLEEGKQPENQDVPPIGAKDQWGGPAMQPVAERTGPYFEGSMDEVTLFLAAIRPTLERQYC